MKNDKIKEWVMDCIKSDVDLKKIPEITADQCLIEQVSFGELDETQRKDSITELADAYRYAFNNFYGDFLFFPLLGTRISLHELLDVGKEARFPIELMDSFPLEEYQRDIENGKRENALLCHDRDTVIKNFEDKLGKNGYASIVRDKITRRILGFSFCYLSKLKEALRLEEWERGFCYSRLDETINQYKESELDLYASLKKKCDQDYFRDPSLFLSKLNTMIQKFHQSFSSVIGQKREFTENDSMVIWNAIAMFPEIRGKISPSEVAAKSLSVIPEEIRGNNLVLGETKYGGSAHKMFEVGGGKNILGFFKSEAERMKKGDNVLICGDISSVIDVYSLPHKEFIERYKSFIKQRRSG